MDLAHRLHANWVFPEPLEDGPDPHLYPDGLQGEFTRLVIDSRQVQPGDLFFALSGEHTDGHRFVQAAFEKGAVACVVQRESGDRLSGPTLVVPDTRAALWEAGLLVRESLRRTRLVGITGSCGKTSTKEFCASALGFLGKTTATLGNANNDLGLPLSFSRFDGDEQFGVLEMGMNAFGEIDRLSSAVGPEVGIITSIFPVHLEGVGSLDGVRKAKGEMIPHIRKVLVVPDTEEELATQGEQRGLRVLRFGDTPQADFRVVDLQVAADHSMLRFASPAGEFSVRIPVPGEHQSKNVLAALAAVHALGQPMEPAIFGLEDTRLPGSRSRLINAGGVQVFDDSYNASPASLAAVWNWAASVHTGRLHLVCGDMLELGEHAALLHREAGQLARSLSCASVVYVGAHARDFASGFGDGDLWVASDPVSAVERIFPALQPGDWVVVKASHGVGLADFVEQLTRKLNAPVNSDGS